jgi:hypothetical protein
MHPLSQVIELLLFYHSHTDSATCETREEAAQILHLLRHGGAFLDRNVSEKERSPARLAHAPPPLNMILLQSGLHRMTNLNNEMVSLITSPPASNGFCDSIGVVRPQYQYILPPVLIVV